MAEQTSVVLVGIGGYGEVYLSALLDDPQGARCKIAGAVDRYPESASRLHDLETRRVPIYLSLEDFFRSGVADLAVISSPIHFHAEHTCHALAYGSNVLVEKPAAAVPSDVDCMVKERDRAGRFAAVGFQWSFASSILMLKRDILSGRFGTFLKGRSLTLWPRTESYYRRNDWAGRRRDSAGRWILDSPACNAMAHDLHNLLFLAGERMDRSAEPVSVNACVARVNDIETYDTVAARVHVASGAELLFLASHAVGERESSGPRFRLDFADATVRFSGEASPIEARYHDGEVVGYDSPNATPQVQKLWTCLDAISGQAEIHCGLEAARPHAAFVEALDRSAGHVRRIPDDRVRRSETPSGTLRWVSGLAAALEGSYDTGDLPRLPGAEC